MVQQNRMFQITFVMLVSEIWKFLIVQTAGFPNIFSFHIIH